MNEQWKQINDFDLYEVSTTGKVRNKKTGRILKTVVSNSGYSQVCLSKNGKQRTKTIHRLVMETFNPVDGMDNLQVNHKDWDKSNNDISNLEWMTPQSNILYGSGPTELKTLDMMLCNAVRKTIHEWYYKLIGVEGTKQMFTETVIENAIKDAISSYTAV